MKQSLFLGASILLGFAVGYGIGKETKNATPSNVKTDIEGSVATITVDFGGALSQGVDSWFDSIADQISEG